MISAFLLRPSSLTFPKASQNTGETIYNTHVHQTDKHLCVNILDSSSCQDCVSAFCQMRSPAALGFQLSDAMGSSVCFLTPNKDSSRCRDQSLSQRAKEEEGVKRLEYTILLWPLKVFTSETVSASDQLKPPLKNSGTILLFWVRVNKKRYKTKQ